MAIAVPTGIRSSIGWHDVGGKIQFKDDDDFCIGSFAQF